MSDKKFKTLIAFGDSITRGHGVPPGSGWVEILSELLKEKGKKSISVFNAGGNGNTSAEGLKRIQDDVLSHMPGLVFVEFGGNDSVHDVRAVSVDEFEKNLLEINKQVTDKGGKIILVTFPPVVNEWHATESDPYYSKWGGLDQCVEQYRQRTRDLAKRLGCPLFDLDKFLRKLMDNKGKEKIIAGDGVHLTEEANKPVAEAVLKFLAELISCSSKGIFNPLLKLGRETTSSGGFEMTEGSGVKKFFERNWERMVLWVILIGLFYMLKPFFLLIFETFLITYVGKGFVQWILSRIKLNYRLTVVFVFMLFLGLLAGAGAWIGPKLIIESNQILSAFTADGEQKTQDKINDFVEDTVVKLVGEKKGQAVIGSEEYTMIMEAMKNELSKAAKFGLPRVLQTMLHIIKIGWEIMVSLVLAFIFSFILVMDWRKISEKMRELENSRISSFYIGAAPHIRAFANILGRALRAQAVIATCNTVFTAIGLWYFQVPNIALLSTIVFLCGFIPILGTFLSSIPILIFGIQAGGLPLVLNLIVFVAAIHAFEAYILNPKITGDILHMHPIVILILLLIGQSFFGIWGMIVGVPIGCYIITVLSSKEENTGI